MKFIAHRGYSKKFAENSLPAFQAVIDHPCNGSTVTGIELDVHLTSDGEIPVMHEISVRGSDGKSVPVAACTFGQLQTLFRRQHGESVPPVPSIEDVLDLVNHRTELCFEIKIGEYDLRRFTDRFAAALDSYRPRGDVVVSSFSYEILEYVRPRLEKLGLRYGFIFHLAAAWDRVPRNVRDRFDLLHPRYDLPLGNPGLFPAGKPIRCWTVNDRATLERLIGAAASLPIEAVMTDDLDLAYAVQDCAP